MFVFIASIIMALFVSFLCSLAESCLLSLSLSDIARITEKKPVAGKIWQRFRDNIHRPIAVILIVNTLAHTIGAATSGAQFVKIFGSKWIWLYSLVFSLIMIQWTEILPKTLGVRYKTLLASFGAVPLMVMEKIFSPFVTLTEILNKPFENIKSKKEQDADAIGEIDVLARFAAINSLISKEQQKIVSRSLDLSKMKVKDIMVRREEIKCLSTSMSLTDALIEAHIHRHTRFPLIEGKTIDRILGYVNFKDIVSALRLNPSNPTLPGIVRPIISVAPEDRIAVVIGKLIKGYNHIAIVKDAAGVTVGLVSLEDVIETVVGDIKDEFDMIPAYINKYSDTQFCAGGAALMQTVTGEPSIEISMTVNEYVKDKLKRAPRVNDVLAVGDFRITVTKVRRSRVFEALFEKKKLLN